MTPFVRPSIPTPPRSAPVPDADEQAHFLAHARNRAMRLRRMLADLDFQWWLDQIQATRMEHEQRALNPDLPGKVRKRAVLHAAALRELERWPEETLKSDLAALDSQNA